MRLRRCVAGRVLECGCLAGVYETYEGGIVTTIDVRGPACTEPGHVVHAPLPPGPAPDDRPAPASRD